MARIRFTRLECEQAQDGFGSDDTFMAVFVDGEYVGNVFRQFSTGQVLPLGFALDFQSEIRVQLWEIDNPSAGNPHDFLGEAQIRPQDTVTNAVFDRAGGRYTLEFELEPEEAESLLVLRKDEANMTANEQQRFLNAIGTLIDNGTFGQFVQNHAGPAGDFEFRNHFFASPFGEMRFLSWHRAYLINLERALRALDPSVFIPYWRWTVNRRIPNWVSNFTPSVGMPNGTNFAVDRDPAAWPLPTQDQVDSELRNSTFAAFTRALERGSHGAVHVWVGGTMRDPAAASSDILFWLHHCEIDRLWDVWQRTNTGGPTLPANERTMDPYAETGEQVALVGDLGYAYA